LKHPSSYHHPQTTLLVVVKRLKMGFTRGNILVKGFKGSLGLFLKALFSKGDRYERVFKTIKNTNC